MFCNTFLGMSLKKWRLSLRKCGRTECFDPHFFSAQLNGEAWRLTTRALNRIATDNSWRFKHDSNSKWRPEVSKSKIEILISENKKKPSIYLENYKVFVCRVENLLSESNREKFWIAKLKMGLNLPDLGKQRLVGNFFEMF